MVGQVSESDCKVDRWKIQQRLRGKSSGFRERQRERAIDNQGFTEEEVREVIGLCIQQKNKKKEKKRERRGE